MKACDIAPCHIRRAVVSRASQVVPARIRVHQRLSFTLSEGIRPRRYGFHKEAAGGTDAEGQKKARLVEIFGHWTDMVTDLIRATPEEDVLRRDIFDRPPIFKWTQARPWAIRTRVAQLLRCRGAWPCWAAQGTRCD